MLVGANARGQNLGYGGIGNNREAPVNGAGRIGVPLVVDIAHRQNKGEDSVLVIDKYLAVVARLDAAEGHRRAGGKAHGEDGGADIGPEGNQACRPADLHPLLHQLLGKLLPVILRGHKHVEVLLLQLLGDISRYLISGSRADDGGETGGGAVNELDPPLPQDDVVGGAQPDVAVDGVFRLGIKIGRFQVSYSLY